MSNYNEKVFLKPYLLVTAFVLAFVAMIMFMINKNNTTDAPVAEEAAMPAEEMAAVEEATAPVATVDVASESGAAEAPAAGAGGKGKEIYDGVCFACHAQGLAGAPIYGDAEAWAGRTEKGIDVMYDHAINGFVGPSGSMMPAKGGRTDIADDDIKAAVDYMMEAVGVAGASAAEAPEASTATASTGSDGKGTYDKVCFVCHATGVAGAPKYGDAPAWEARIAQGNDVLYDHAINGFMGTGLMPPKGGNPDLSDDDVKAAVDYMLSSVQ